LLDKDTDYAIAKASRFVSNFNELPTIAKTILINMAFNLGNRLDEFQEFKAALENMDLLLSSFTEGIEAHPDDVIVLKKVMDQLVNVKRFFTKRSAARFNMHDWNK